MKNERATPPTDTDAVETRQELKTKKKVKKRWAETSNAAECLQEMNKVGNRDRLHRTISKYAKKYIFTRKVKRRRNALTCKTKIISAMLKYFDRFSDMIPALECP